MPGLAPAAKQAGTYVARAIRAALHGRPAWGAVHVLFLVNGRSRAGVVSEWLWDYFTLRRGTHLITGKQPPG